MRWLSMSLTLKVLPFVRAQGGGVEGRQDGPALQVMGVIENPRDFLGAQRCPAAWAGAWVGRSPHRTTSASESPRRKISCRAIDQQRIGDYVLFVEQMQ